MMEENKSVARKMINRKLIFGIIFLLVGFFLLYYVFTGECSIEPITTDVMGQEIEIGLPAFLERLICNATTFPNIFLWLVGLAMIFPGVGGIFKGLTAE